MKIFWSWQSDRRFCKQFVREALDAAAERLQDDQEVEEADRPIEVDQDTQGKAGMVDIPATILGKIDESDVFVADLTSLDKPETGRQIANPNVLIELGYAMKALPHHRIISVANTAFGFNPKKLPFDIAHRRGPIQYRLQRNADPEERSRVAEELTVALVDALRPMLEEVRAASVEPAAVFVATSFSTDRARWWKPGEVLYSEPNLLREPGVDLDVRAPSEPLLYFRLKPTIAMENIPEPELRGHAAEMSLLIPAGAHGRSPVHNRYGGLSYWAEQVEGGFDLTSGSQIFRNREVWSFDCTSTRTHPADAKFSGGSPFLAHSYVEAQVRQSIPHIIKVATSRLGVPLPIDLELGLAPSFGFRMTTGHFGKSALSGPCQLDFIAGHTQLMSLDLEGIESAVFDLLKQLWAGFGMRREF
jgi:hypothetical protein